jgi:hypothetical protein
MTDKIWNTMDPVAVAFWRAFDLALDPEIAPYTAGAVCLVAIGLVRMRKTAVTARG